MRRAVVFLVAACTLVPALPGASTRADDSSAQQAAKEIADARERANAAADAYFQAESKLDVVANQTTSILSLLRRYQAMSQLYIAEARLQATLGVEPAGLVRIGLLHYNTEEEVERFVEAIARA